MDNDFTTQLHTPGPRLAVIGPGALGTLFTARLTQAGIPTLLFDYRPERAKALRKKGIRLIDVSGESTWHPPVSADPRTLAEVDVALVLVKAYQTEDVGALLGQYLSPHAIAITLQNGLGNSETLQFHLGQDRVVGGTTAQGAMLDKPGLVRDTGSGPTILGKSDGQADSRLDDAVQALLLAGFSVSITTDVQSAIWSKAIVNAAINPVAALTRLRNGPLAEHQPSLQLMTAAAREAYAVAKAHGIALNDQDWRARLQTICQATAENINSMLADVLHCRRTEIHAINGAIAHLAAKHGLSAVVNRTLTNLISSLEHGYLNDLSVT